MDVRLHLRPADLVEDYGNGKTQRNYLDYHAIKLRQRDGDLALYITRETAQKARELARALDKAADTVLGLLQELDTTTTKEAA